MINTIYAQYPCGVSTVIARGYKLEYYNGTFSNQTQFGVGTTNTVPGLTAYTNEITGSEFYNNDADYFGLEYSLVLENAVAGSYRFQLNGDDRSWLYIAGNLVFQALHGDNVVYQV